MLVHWIWLSQLSGLSLQRKVALVRRFRDPEEIYRASEESFRELGADVAALENKDLSCARRIIDRCAQLRIGILTYGDGAYPTRLKNVEEPPLVLYYKGVLPDWESAPVIGVVGTRKASLYGLQTAAAMGMQLAAGGALVVSGGASGIDTSTLKGALNTGKPAVAVLGFGPDVIYPKNNSDLFAKIAEQGCLISEYPPGTPAYSWNFPRRNRIISGISNGVLVVEAPVISGALITARNAWDQGRDVFVVPGNIDMETSAGSNGLLRERATAVFTGWDILREYESMYPGKLTRVEGKPAMKLSEPAAFPKQDIPGAGKNDKLSVDNRDKSHYSVLNNAPELTQEEKNLLKFLSDTPVSVDEVIAQAGVPAAKVLSILTVLGLKGVVINHPGKCVSLK